MNERAHELIERQSAAVTEPKLDVSRIIQLIERYSR